MHLPPPESSFVDREDRQRMEEEQRLIEEAEEEAKLKEKLPNKLLADMDAKEKVAM